MWRLNRIFVLLIAPLCGMNVFEIQGLFIQDWLLTLALVLPASQLREVGVVAQRFAVGGLELFAEVAATRFGSMECVEAHQFAEFEKVRHAAGILERLIQLFTPAENIGVLPELFTKL